MAHGGTSLWCGESTLNSGELNVSGCSCPPPALRGCAWKQKLCLTVRHHLHHCTLLKGLRDTRGPSCGAGTAAAYKITTKVLPLPTLPLPPHPPPTAPGRSLGEEQSSDDQPAPPLNLYTPFLVWSRGQVSLQLESLPMVPAVPRVIKSLGTGLDLYGVSGGSVCGSALLLPVWVACASWTFLLASILSNINEDQCSLPAFTFPSSKELLLPTSGDIVINLTFGAPFSYWALC